MTDGRMERGPVRRVAVAVLAVAVLLAGCTGDDAAQGDDPNDDLSTTPDAAGDGPATSEPSGSDGPSDGAGTTPPTAPGTDGPAPLADPPRSASVWASTIGLPVVGAVRTSTPLARLAVLPVEEWPATCEQVAVELDTIAAPPVLTALAVTADPETATLLVGDLRAKADLLAVCDRDTPERETLVAEVAATHEVAVAWLRVVGGGA